MACAGRTRRNAAATALGLDRHEGSGISGHLVCGQPHRPGHGEHDAAEDDGRIPESRNRGRDPHGRRRRREARPCRGGSTGSGSRRRHRSTGRGRRAAVRGRRRMRCLRRSRPNARPSAAQRQGQSDAYRDDRSRPDGGEHRAPADARRTPDRRVRSRSGRDRGSGCRRRDVRAVAAGTGHASRGSPHFLGDAARG